MDSVNQTSAPSREAIASVSKHYSAITDTFPDAESNFERKWVAWIAVCLAQAGGGAEMDPCVEAEEFEIVKRLGPKIIPFVVFKLAKYDEENYLYGVFLYEALERDASYRAERAGDEKTLSPACKEVLQHLRSRIVELNYQRNQVFEERVAAWIEFHQAHWVKSNSQYFTYCEEYWDLLEMGTSIIAPLMVEYERLQWGYWFHLLHELVHGHKLRAHSYQKPVLYDECVRWFIEGDHEDAPLYVPTESDRKYIGSMEGFWEDSPTGQQ